MPSKLQFYSEFAERTARQITGSYRSWTAFLATAARLYKYPYNEQLMIYAQRPNATACAETAWVAMCSAAAPASRSSTPAAIGRAYDMFLT